MIGESMVEKCRKNVGNNGGNMKGVCLLNGY